MLGVTPQYIYKIGQGWIDPLLPPPPRVQSAFFPAELAEWIKQEIEQANRKRNGSNGGTSMKYGT